MTDLGLATVLGSRDFLLAGLLTTIELSLLATLLAMLVGIAVGALRAYGGPAVSVALSLYVDLFRSIPMLVLLIWFFFVFPLLFQINMQPLMAAIIVLGLHTGAYISEIVRGGLLSVRAGQMRAALALGMTGWQAIRRIVLPQALIRMLPPIGSQFAITIKDSAITSVIAAPELLRQSQIVANQTMRPFETFTSIMIVYFLIVFPVVRGVDYVYRQVAHLGAS